MSESLLGGRYTIVAVLGVGGFGQTYLAEDTQHPEQHQCVIKQFKPTSQDPKFLDIARRLFDTEVKTLERLGQHPQIPDFLNFFEDNGEFYLVQEFIEGHSLSYEFATIGKFDEGKAIALLQDVLQVLEFVHDNQVIHRDIKPGNLIRRQRDGRVVLIDFGAVKELQTQLTTKIREQTGQTSFTVGIGTQGYSPSEQLAGQPRFCSDIYALGVTVIQALTRLHPTQLPINPDTGELIWRDYAVISFGLADILERMVRYHFSARFQSVRQVLDAIQNLTDVDLDPTDIPDILLDDTRLLDRPDSEEIESQEISPQEISSQEISSQEIKFQPIESQESQDESETHLHPAETRLEARSAQSDPSTPSTLPLRSKTLKPWLRGVKTVAIASLAVTGVVLGIRQVGLLEATELITYDQMIRLRSPLEPDPRLLIVEISEQDLRALNRPTPSDRDVARVIRNLAQHQPRVIGLDLHREIPQEPGHAELMQQFQAPNLITILKLGDTDIEIPAPAGIPPEQIGFSDVPVDADGVIRRNLMLASTSTETFYSFSLRVALSYLAQQDIRPLSNYARPDWMQLKDTVFVPLNANSGGYQQLDAGGYQLLLDYSSPTSPSPVISFTDALNGQIDPTLVQDKIVLIGTTAASSKDLFLTPYSAGRTSSYTMPGVVLHAQMVSQFLRSVLDQRPLLWVVPEWAEWLWIAGWAILGSSLAWVVRHPAKLGLGVLILLTTLLGTTVIIFLTHGWLPVIAPSIALVAGSMAIVSYRAYTKE